MAAARKHGGRREGAGRPKGSLNRRSVEAIEAVAREFPDWSPLQHLARVANDAKLDEAIRLDAARAAAPFIHPRPRSIDLDPDALVDLEGRIAEARAGALARKGFLPTDAFADRLQRAVAASGALDREPDAGRAASELPTAPPAPVQRSPVQSVRVPPSPSPLPEPKPEPKAAVYQPIVSVVWPDAVGLSLVNYDPLKD